MLERRIPLRHCALALLVFVAAAVPFHRRCAGMHADLVLAGARIVTTLSGPSHVLVATPAGTVEVDRTDALEEFYRDPEQQPRPHGLLVFWAWVVVAPLHSARRRLSLLTGGTLVLTAVYALARACDASAWFQAAAVALAAGAPANVAPGSGLLDVAGAVLSSAALVVVPGVLALTAYPGFARATITDRS